ncbi:unnamed protein product [Peronospora effusa]|nr:unnamed protein product [Peronospora effusa]
MRVKIGDDGSYRIDQEEAIKELLRAHGMNDASTTKTPIGGECYETHAPRNRDKKLAKRIAKYLKGTATLKLTKAPSESSRDVLLLEAYSDVDFAAYKADRKSLTGELVILKGMAVSWCTKKQGSVSLSTMEA